MKFNANDIVTSATNEFGGGVLGDGSLDLVEDCIEIAHQWSLECADGHADGDAPRRAPDAVLRRPARVGEDPREEGGRGQGQPAAQEEDLRVGARHRRRHSPCHRMRPP